MEAIVTLDATGEQTRQHFELGGSELVPVPVYKPEAVAAAPLPTPTPFKESDLKGPVTAASQELRDTRTARQDSTVLESMAAAVKTWDATNLFDWLARPKFEGPKINPAEYLDHVGLVLNEDEHKYFTSIGDTQAGADYAMDKIRTLRKAYDRMGDNPTAAMVTQILDPAWLAVPPAFKVGKLAGTAGRAASAATAGAITLGIDSMQDRPLSDTELVLNLVANTSAAALLFNPKTAKIEKIDPSQPSEAADRILQSVADQRVDVEGVPPSLQPGTKDRVNVLSDLDTQINADHAKRGLGENLQWNVRKTIAGYSPVGEKVANLFLDNNSDLTKHSMESHRAAIMTDLNQYKFAVDNKIMDILGKQNKGHVTMLTSPRATYEAQAEIERLTMLELYRREQLTRQGVDFRLSKVDADISELADRVDAFHRRALQEQKAAGVKGAENIDPKDGFVHRVWDAFKLEDARNKLVAAGLSPEKAMRRINGMLAGSLRRANNWDKELANEVAQAITQRALAKGQFEDSLFNGLIDNSQIEQLKQIMRDGGMKPENIEKAINKIKVNQDDAGKVGYLKHRVYIDYTAVHRENGAEIRLVDLLDNRLIDHVDRYSKSASTEAAFARVGVSSSSDVQRLRGEFVASVPQAQRGEAAKLYDNLINYFKGLPAGAELNPKMRLMQTYGRTISLSWAGLWQLMDYATQASEFGMLKTVKYATKELPGFSSLLKEAKDSPEIGRSLKDVLTQHSEANLRMRPFLHRLEDNFELDTGSTAQLLGQAGGQLVSVVNGLKFVHHHQARTAANLIINRLDIAGAGNAKAQAALKKYGLELDVLEKVTQEIKKHGYNVDAWDDTVWANTRPTLHKMMDEYVLQSRVGDLPAFMLFDTLGKFLGTYRNFTFTAHNKILAGKLARDGSAAFGLMLLYQMPLSYLAVAAQSAVMGKNDSEAQIASKAVGMLGGLGLLAEPMNWAMGNSNEFGTPGTIPIDRLIKVGQDPTATNLMNATPIAAANPLWKALGAYYKEE